MPRKGTKGKWNLKVSPDEWYQKEDPWNIGCSKEEFFKADLIRGLIENEEVLDIGCGEGFWTRTYGINPVGVDISYIAVGRARMYGIKAKRLDITCEWIDKKFKTIILSEVLYYIKPSLWEYVSAHIKQMLENGGQFIISCGQYFTEKDIRKIFPWCEFDKVFKLPSEKYEYNLIMSGHKCSR